jgi:hypothetical protein
MLVLAFLHKSIVLKIATETTLKFPDVKYVLVLPLLLTNMLTASPWPAAILTELNYVVYQLSKVVPQLLLCLSSVTIQ